MGFMGEELEPRPRPKLVMSGLVALVCVLAGCAQVPVGAAASASSGAVPGLTPSAASNTASAVSAESIEYARSLGGSSHRGETLFLVVGVSVDTEESARAALTAAIPLFGDMQSYFVVQRSDNFDGLSPGSWVVIEAYRDRPSSENLDFGRRGFPDSSVRRVVVTTTDPIPVVEDMLSGG